MRISAWTMLATTLVPAAIGGAEPAVTPFELLADGSVVVSVFVGDAGPFDFVLDTGSTRTIVSPQLVNELGLRPFAQSLMVTPSGDDIRPVVHLRDVQASGLPPVTVAALVSNHLDIAAGMRVAGVIGQDVLAPLVYTIDYRRRQVAWNVDMDTAGRERLPLELAEGRFLLSLPQPHGRHSLRLVPDSGTSAFVLYAGRSQKLPPLTPLQIGTLQTLEGRAPVRLARLDEVWVGSVLLKNQPAVILSQARDGGLADGLLPLHMFARVTFNGPGRYLIVEAR